ncbi:MAG: dienelactone hydrolase family protein [Gammaproteobacteria bacterium]|nr:dienelactone hydrolase family protein [Gammaproteobacteria bacterium]MDP2142366.1 dienelactone hydrolase family protein [Gammaproteobacteria bacterium]MDP2348607.1 dienelactone hydrolase family protein [Gammaproteobacteria bacterium]
MKTEYIDYRDGDRDLEGYFAYDETADSPQPLVLIAHDWSGRREFACSAAERMVELGYAGFALDMYGKGVFGKDGDTAGNSALMAPFASDRLLLRRRVQAALVAARALPQVDANLVAAVGYCFGGMTVLELARSGADVLGVIAVHGLLGAGDAANAAITAKVLCLHGHDDPMGPPAQVLEFETEMSAAGADWQMHIYGGTKHAFTNPAAKDQQLGTVYNMLANSRAQRAIADFLAEVFADPLVGEQESWQAD